MIKEMEFIEALQFAKVLKCYFRPEFHDNWISPDDLSWVSQYGVPVENDHGVTQYVTLFPWITSENRWEFKFNEELYKKIEKMREQKNAGKSESKDEIQSVEQFPSPVRLCDLKSKDMFRLADDVHKGLYCILGKDWDGRISVSNFEEHPDSNYYKFRPNILVYKTDKNGGIVDATSEV